MAWKILPNTILSPSVHMHGTRWAFMHHFLYACLSVCRDLTKIQTGPKVTRQKVISSEPFDLGAVKQVPRLLKKETRGNPFQTPPPSL